MTPEEASKQIEKDLQEKEAAQELFQKKVLMIGELHTERALWANRIGQLKSISITQTYEMAEDFEEKLKDLESRMSDISTGITDFKPESVEHLESFKNEMKEKFAALESLYKELENTEAEGNPDAGDEKS